MANSPSYMEGAEAHLLTRPVRYLQSRLQALTGSYASLKPLAQSSSRAYRFEPDEPSETESEAPTLPISSSSRSKIEKTYYHFCHPPPSSRTHRSLTGSPRLLLQLRRSEHGGTASPQLELYRAQPFLKHHKKPSLAVIGESFIVEDDLVVAACEDSDFSVTFSGCKASNSHQEVISLIHPPSASEDDCGRTTTLSLQDGRFATNKLADGSYEFLVDTDGNPQIMARWARRTEPKEGDAKESASRIWYKFLLVNKADKRSYAVASLSPLAITVLSKHTAPALAVSRSGQADGAFDKLKTPQIPSSSAWPPETVVDTTFQLKRLILVTATWVAISEGWVPSVRPRILDTETSAKRSRRSSQVLVRKMLGDNTSSDYALPSPRASAQSPKLGTSAVDADEDEDTHSEDSDELSSSNPSNLPEDEDPSVHISNNRSSIRQRSARIKTKLKTFVEERRHTV